MALIINPATYSPVSAEIWLSANSAGSSAYGFKYVYNVKKYDMITGVSASLGEYDVPPRPTTGYGIFSPAKLVRSQLTYNLQPFIILPTTALNSITQFNVEYGTLYNPNILFVDIVPYIGSNAWLGCPYNIFGPPNPALVAGADIDITLDNFAVNPQFNGAAKIVSVTQILGWQYVEINKPIAGYVPGSSGYITGIKSLLTASPKWYAYNGTRQYEQISENFSNTHVFWYNNEATHALTNYKDGLTYSTFPPGQAKMNDNFKSIFLTEIPGSPSTWKGQYETLSLLVDDPSGFRWTINQYNSSYQCIGTYSNYGWPNISITTAKRYDFPIGTQNLIDAGWVTDWTNTKYYSLRVERQYGDEPPYSFAAKYIKYYEIVCNPSPYPNYRIAFLNLHGGFDYWNFNWKSTNTLSVDKTLFRKQLPYSYSVGDRQDTVLSQKATEGYTVASDFITEYDSNFLKELIESPEVYVVDETNKKYYPIVVDTKSWSAKKKLNDKLFCATFDFHYAYDVNLYNS